MAYCTRFVLMEMCRSTATFRVSWCSDGSDSVYCCSKHLAATVRALQERTNNGKERTFRVTVLRKEPS